MEYVVDDVVGVGENEQGETHVCLLGEVPDACVCGASAAVRRGVWCLL